MRELVLSILRYTARAGLSFARVAWCLTRSPLMIGSIPVGPAAFGVGSFSAGWITFYIPPLLAEPACGYQLEHEVDPTDLCLQFDEQYAVLNQTVPGMEYRSRIGGGEHLLLFRHWLVCLMFLTATVVTSWRCKKPATMTENET